MTVDILVLVGALFVLGIAFAIREIRWVRRQEREWEGYVNKYRDRDGGPK